MAKKPTVSTIASGYYSTTILNSNFEALRDAFENTVSRDGSTPNTMSSDFDLNNNDILNVKTLNTNALRLNGESVSTVLQSFKTEIKYTFSTVANLLADEKDYTYFAAGDTVQAEGFLYNVVATTATDHHLTTVGGVKLKYLPGAEGYNIKALGAVDGGDIADALELARDAIGEDGGNIYIPRGTYTLSRGIEFAPPGGSAGNMPVASLEMEPGAQIDYTGAEINALSWDATTSTAKSFAGLRLKGVRLFDKSGQTANRGIYVIGVNYMSDEDCYISGFASVQYYVAAAGGTSGGLWSQSRNLTVAGGKKGVYTNAANAWTYVKTKCLSQTEVGFESISASVQIVGFSAVPGSSTSYNAMRTHGSTLISGFEFENTQAATINGFLIDVQGGWTQADSISTRSTPSGKIIGSSNGLGTYTAGPTFQSNQGVNEGEFLHAYSRACEVRGYDTSDITFSPTVGALGQGQLSIKPYRKTTTPISPGVNNSLSGYQNLWTTGFQGVTKFVTPDIRGIKIEASGLASTIDMYIYLIDANTVSDSTNTSSILKTVGNGTTRLTYDEMMDLLDYEGAVFRIVTRARVPEATYSGTVDVTVQYRLD